MIAPAAIAAVGTYVNPALGQRHAWTDANDAALLPAAYDSAPHEGAHVIDAAHGTANGTFAHNFGLLDWYNRIHVSPAGHYDLGNIAGVQQFPIVVWNGYFEARTLDTVTVENAPGLTLTAPPGALPMPFAPLQAQSWVAQASADGPPQLDATLTWAFAGEPPVALEITGQRLTAWVFVPDWSQGVIERLSWKTRLFQSPTAAEQRSAARLSPRAAFEFPVRLSARTRTLFDLAIYDAGARVWALPIWHDVQWLSAEIPAGALHVPSSGVRDFRAGGLGMLRASENAFVCEVFEIEALDDDGLVLKRPLTTTWPAGSRLYPARTARFAAQPAPARQTDNYWTSQVQLQLAEGYDWPAAAPPTLYRGAPVIEDAPEESDDLALGWERFTEVLDSDTGKVSSIDTAGIGFATPGHRWLARDRAGHNRLRGLLYYLNGMLKPVWLPTFAQDLELMAPVGQAEQALTIGFCGYTAHAQARAGRRDIRIERVRGAPLYRRITGSSVVDATTERISIDTPLGVDLDVADVTRISFMALVRKASDDVELHHETDADGITDCADTFRVLRDDVELPA